MPVNFQQIYTRIHEIAQSAQDNKRISAATRIDDGEGSLICNRQEVLVSRDQSKKTFTTRCEKCPCR